MQHLLRSASRLRKKKKRRKKERKKRKKKLVVPLCFMFYLTLQNKPLFFFSSLLVSVCVCERLFHCNLRAQYPPTIIFKVFLRFLIRFGFKSHFTPQEEDDSLLLQRSSIVEASCCLVCCASKPPHYGSSFHFSFFVNDVCACIRGHALLVVLLLCSPCLFCLLVPSSISRLKSVTIIHCFPPCSATQRNCLCLAVPFLRGREDRLPLLSQPGNRITFVE